jgi:CheY-like chemotaxis protein
MRILWVGDEDEFRRGVTESLQSVGHSVRHAHGDGTAVAVARQDAPHVVLFAPRELNAGALDLLSKLREDGKPPPHVLLVGAEPPESFLVQAYEQGLDGELARARGEAYVRSRITSLERRLDPTKKTLVPVKPGTPALSPIELVARSGAWRGVRPSFAEAVGKFLTLAAHSIEVPIPAPSLTVGCEILLSSAALELEMRVALAVDAPTAKTLAIHLFGEESSDLEIEMMHEVANICMGTVKTALSAEQLAFAAGLPKAVQSELVLRPVGDWRTRDCFAIRAVDAMIVVGVALRSKANTVVAVGSVVEGMVLAKDVYNPRGMLLLTAGTRLSSRWSRSCKACCPPSRCSRSPGVDEVSDGPRAKQARTLRHAHGISSERCLRVPAPDAPLVERDVRLGAERRLRRARAR